MVMRASVVVNITQVRDKNGISFFVWFDKIFFLCVSMKELAAISNVYSRNLSMPKINACIVRV